MKTKEEILDKIRDKSIKFLATRFLESVTLTAEQESDIIAITDWLDFLLETENMLNDNSNSVFVDILYCACLMHNAFYIYDEEDFTKLFLLRKWINEFEERYKIDERWIEAVCQAVEGQLGAKSPSALLIPMPGNPSKLFSTACSIWYKKVKNA